MVEMNRVVHPPTTALTALGALARNFCCFPKGKSQLKLVTQYRLRLEPSRVHVFRLYGFSRSEEHTSELQSLRHLVCRLLLEKKKNNQLQFSTCRLTDA